MGVGGKPHKNEQCVYLLSPLEFIWRLGNKMSGFSSHVLYVPWLHLRDHSRPKSVQTDRAESKHEDGVKGDWLSNRAMIGLLLPLLYRWQTRTLPFYQPWHLPCLMPLLSWILKMPTSCWGTASVCKGRTHPGQVQGWKGLAAKLWWWCGIYGE